MGGGGGGGGEQIHFFLDLVWFDLEFYGLIKTIEVNTVKVSEPTHIFPVQA